MRLVSLNRTMTLVSRLFDHRHSTIPLVQPTAVKPAFSGTPAVRLPRATPESQGVSPRAIAAFFRALAAEKTLNMHSVTVLRNGYILAQATFGDWDADVWKATFSQCKSVVSLAVGLLVDEGCLRVSDRVVDYFDAQMSPLSRLKLRELTVEDLLTMRSGVTFGEAESVSEEDWLKAFFNAPVRGEIGATFHYNSLNTYLLSALVRQVSGESLCDYLRPRLFDPLGIGEVYWETCPRGIEKGGWGLFIRPEDMAKLALLVMQRGVWQGKRLLSEEWIAAATTAQTEAPADYGDYDYGYQIWTGRSQHRFLFNGMVGQNAMGFWDNGILLVSNAGNDEIFQQSRYFSLAHEAFGGKFPAALPPDTDGERELREVIASLRAVYPAPPRQRWWERLLCRPQSTLPPLCEQLNGVEFAVANEEEASSVGLLPVTLQALTSRYTEGVRRLRFAVEDDTFVLYYTEVGGEHRVPVGFYAAARCELVFGGDMYWVAVRGRWATDEDERPVLLLRLSFLETPYERRLKLVLDGDTLQLWQEERPGDEFIWMLVDSGKSGAETPRLLNGALQRVDSDYFHYKTERLFAPRLTFQAEET